MKSFIYIFRRFRTASILNIIGLTSAFAMFYIIMTQIEFNKNYNRGITDYENLYRIETIGPWNDDKWHSQIFRPITDILGEISQVENISLFNISNERVLIKDDSKMIAKYCTALPHSIENLQPNIICGTLELKPYGQFVIPASLAMTYFGTTDAIGKTIIFENQTKGEVTGVYEDFPENSFIPNAIYASIGDENDGNYWNWNYKCLVRLHEEANPDDVAEIAKDKWFKRIIREMSGNVTDEDVEADKDRAKRLKLRLNPASETYFSNIDPLTDHGNIGIHTVMQLSCILIIIVAAINFINFSLAETPMRIKSINTRKILGSSTLSLRMSLLVESTITSLVAFALATLIIYTLNNLPEFGQLIVGTLDISSHIMLWLSTLGISVAVGITSGLYPSYYVTSFAPAMVIKGSFGLSPTGQILRKGLMVIQMTAAFIMVVYISVIYLQRNYIFNSDYGFDKDEIVFTSLSSANQGNKDAIRSELLKIPGIENVSYSMMTPGINDLNMEWGRGEREKYVNLVVFPVDWHFLDTYGIKILEGRNFNQNDSDVYIVNKAGRDMYSWIEMDKPITDGDLPVVGVCENIRFASTRIDNDKTPMCFVIFGKRYQDWGDQLGTLNVRIAANVDKIDMMSRIKEVLSSTNVGEHINTISFFDMQLEYTYKDEMRFIKQIEIFSIICVIITLIGVFCLTMFETEYRHKEIGIRKVMGSTTSEVLVLIVKQYIPLIIFSFVLATPVAYYMGEHWLQNFAEHTDIHWWIFPLTLIIVFFTVIATVVTQSYKAANENPINSIKTE